MNKKISILLIIASLGLAIAGLIFIFISIFGDKESNWSLCSGLACVALANMFNWIGYKKNKKKKR